MDLAVLYLIMRALDVILVIAVLALMLAHLQDWRAASQPLRLLGLSLVVLMIVTGYGSLEAVLLGYPTRGIRTPLILIAHAWCLIAIMFPLIFRDRDPN